MKIGIMQPYFFPYLGYFQLIQAVDRFVIYDDVNFIKGGWVNRNFILSQGRPQRITMQLFGASPNKLINAIEVGSNMKKLLMTISQAYSKAPCYSLVFPMIETCLTYPEKNLARFLEFSLRTICDYFGIKTEMFVSSSLKKDNNLKGSEKVIAICKSLDGKVYINAIGGKELYNQEHFQQNELELFFLQMGPVTYPQLRGDFVPNLSIIDIMMFNSQERISRLLNEYKLVD
jgi:hypothetical protein